jgi:amidase
MDEFATLDGIAQAALVQSGEITASELVEAAIRRIEATNPQLNAVVTEMFDQARAAAQTSQPTGPLSGVPFLLKDLGVAYKGVRLTGGSAALANYLPNTDATLVERTSAAGLIVLGKTNTPEFGLLPTTEPAFLGTCRNPWDITRSTGGSSGGAAAAVAAGMVPLAHASDGGGSIRIPAACCGLFGLKPTRGRVPSGPSNGDVMSGLSTSGCVSRSVRDSAAFLDMVSGPSAGDPYWAPPQQRPFLHETTTPPGQLRIAFSTVAPNGVAIDGACVTAVHHTAQLCSDLGHHVEEAAPAFDAARFNDAFMALWAAGCAWTVKGISLLTNQPPNPAQYEPLTWAMYEQGEKLTAADYLLAVQALQLIGRQIAAFYASYDLWLTPVVAEPPLPLGQFDPLPNNPRHGIERAIAFVPFTPIANATGQPAMSLPLHWTESGLPVGVHFMGRFGDEATLLQLAAQLEAAQPWAQRTPPIFG